jgi:hypothetical protein
MNSYLEAIEAFYGYRTAERSNVPLIKHIHEGIKILEWRGANLTTINAFTIHPLFQNDADLKARYYTNWIVDFTPSVVLLAMEYRSVANEYLPKVSKPAVIRLSPLHEVNEMLIADKVQNRKDFLKYNSGIPNADRLKEYFKDWLDALGVSEELYQEYANRFS